MRTRGIRGATVHMARETARETIGGAVDTRRLAGSADAKATRAGRVPRDVARMQQTAHYAAESGAGGRYGRPGAVASDDSSASV